MIPQELRGQSEALGMTLSDLVRAYFDDENHRREFEAWYLEQYGKPYEWKEKSV